MILSDRELQVTFDRLARLQAQILHLRLVESNPVNYHLSASGFIAEIDRMQLEIREYLSFHPSEIEGAEGVLDIPDWHRNEVERRRAAAEVDPMAGIAWEEFKPRLADRS